MVLSGFAAGRKSTGVEAGCGLEKPSPTAMTRAIGT